MKCAKVYQELAYRMLWGLVTFLSLLTYITDVRPLFYSLFSGYFAGLFDGILATVLVLVIIFYLMSKKVK